MSTPIAPSQLQDHEASLPHPQLILVIRSDAIVAAVVVNVTLGYDGFLTRLTSQ